MNAYLYSQMIKLFYETYFNTKVRKHKPKLHFSKINNKKTKKNIKKNNKKTKKNTKKNNKKTKKIKKNKSRFSKKI